VAFFPVVRSELAYKLCRAIPPLALEIQMDVWKPGVYFCVAVLTSLFSGTRPALAARETVVGILKGRRAIQAAGRGKPG